MDHAVARRDPGESALAPDEPVARAPVLVDPVRERRAPVRLSVVPSVVAVDPAVHSASKLVDVVAAPRSSSRP